MKTRAGLVALLLRAFCVGAMYGGAIAASSAAGAADDQAVSERVQSAGRAAHLGIELCDFTPAGLARFKTSLRRAVGNPADFDDAWNYGWKRAAPVLLQFQSLRASDPQDYALRVRRICSTLRREGKRVEESPAAQAPPQ
ncbi:hypothetical protein [Paraburkholderia sp. DHOC27]|uniref:hypothetical protein n=1 Tax=Paraburkholderia sp. DHOC27 TaxID=2303330 RepID=UPI000E3EE3B0|nr:hypothetical protein [Paraburkholderia sp. DHOC27]RFU44732.1 hypothetical protein D0B32_26930 [Paraburkholderia sp. DHOC27]